MEELKFLEKYERLKKEVRARRELAEFATNVNVGNTLKYIKEIEIIREAFSKACNSYSI